MHVHGVDGVDSLDDGRGGAIDRGAAASLRGHRFLPDDGCVRAAGAARCPGADCPAPVPNRIRAGRACCPHIWRATSSTSGVRWRAAGRLSADAAARVGRLGTDRPWSRQAAAHEAFDGAEILDEIDRAAPDVGIVTVAPELDGALDLIAWLAARGHRVSLGHSGATYEQALEAIAAGARHATHLFNRMPRLEHRAPGLVGAILQTDEVAAELICDGVHVHPALIRTAVAAKRPGKVLAITDGTAAAGLAEGGQAALGGRPITVRESAAYLPDGTLAGSILTMDAAFRTLVNRVGVSLVDAVTMSATTPARELGLVGHGRAGGRRGRRRGRSGRPAAGRPDIRRRPARLCPPAAARPPRTVEPGSGRLRLSRQEVPCLHARAARWPASLRWPLSAAAVSTSSRWTAIATSTASRSGSTSRAGRN